MIRPVELVRRVRQGDDLAAQELFDRYVHRLVALARQRINQRFRHRIDAEDVVQSAYESIFRLIKDREYDLKRRGDLWRLLATVTLRKLNKQVKRHTAARRSVYLRATTTQQRRQ